MFAILAILLVIAWNVAFFAFHVTGFSRYLVLALTDALFMANLATERTRSPLDFSARR